MVTRLRHNILANLLGKGWAALISLAFVPLYIKLMGVEAYGLIGLFSTMLVLSSLFDLGLSSVLTRELARFSGDTRQTENARNLSYTLELIYWVSALAIMLLLWSLAPLLTDHWVKPQHLDSGAIRDAFVMMGAAIALQYPSALYIGGMAGLQQQVALNAMVAVFATIRAVGAVALLLLIEPTVQVFLGWQLMISMAQSLVARYVFWRHLPASQTPRGLEFRLLYQNWRFAAGMGVGGVLAVILTQADKLILGGILPLGEFGYYNFAAAIASGLLLLAMPFYSVLFPRFSRLVKDDNYSELVSLYHASSQLLATITIPLGMVIAVFSFPLLMLWTGDQTTAENTHRLVTYLVIGQTMNSLVFIPYALQVAYGWTSLVVWQNAIAIVVLAPLLLLGVKYFGAEGAGLVWILLNVGYLAISIPVMHRRLLQAEKYSWYRRAVLIPFLAPGLVVMLNYVFVPPMEGILATSIQIVVVLVLSWGLAGLMAPYPRKMLLKYLRIRVIN